MAALNLIRADALAAGTAIAAGGPKSLYGVGQSETRGVVQLGVTLGDLTFMVPFTVVDELPVAGLLGKPTLTLLKATLNLAADTATISHQGHTTELRAIALIAPSLDSKRPEAQSFWNWINKRLAAASKRLQIAFQDVMERAEDETLEQFLASFPEWSLFQRQMSGNDDANVHPAPYLAHLRRPEAAATGLVVCPTLVHVGDILSEETEMSLIADADDNRNFLPPTMSFAEEDKHVDKHLLRLLAEAELSPDAKIG